MSHRGWVLAALCLVLFDAAAFSGLPARRVEGAPGVAAPSTVQTIYFVNSSHWDYGYTDPPQNLPSLVRTHLNEVVTKCLADTRHRYTIESVWMLEDYLSVATPGEIDTLLQLVRDGRIALSSAYASAHSGIMSPEELDRWLYRTKRLRDERNIPSRAAVVNDNPGYSWGMPDALAGSGIDRLVAGPNTGLSEPFPLPLSESIFRWKGPGGGEVLTWLCRGGYIEGFERWQIDANTSRFFYGSQHPEWAGWTNQQIMQQGIDAQLGLLAEAGYPYDAVLVFESFDKMSYDPSNSILAEIATWNATHTSPQIVVATPDEFFDHMVATYGLDAFPVRSGNWTQRWERTKIFSQKVQSRYREIRDSLSATEVASSIAAQTGALYPAETVDTVYRDLMRFDDHGAGCGGTEAGLMTLAEVNQTNRYWTQLSLSQRDLLRAALDASLGAIASQVTTPADENRDVVVFNPLSSARTDVVRTPIDTGGRPFELRDATTNLAVPYRTREDGSVEFVATNVPSMGYKRYRAILGVTPSSPVTVTAAGTTVESAFYRVTVSSTDGAITSIVDKTGGNRELVNPSSPMRFNKTVKGSNAADYLGLAPNATTSGAVTITASPGAVSGALTLTFTVAGGRNASPLSRVEIRLYDALKRIDITNTHDRTRLAYTVTASGHSDHFYQPFPFNLAIATTSPYIDANAAQPLAPPTATYLTGPSDVAVNNSHTPSRGITLRDTAASYEVQMVSPELAIYSIGSNLDSWDYAPSEATVIAESLFKQDRCVTDDPGHPEVDFVLEPLEGNPSQPHTIYASQISLTSGAPRTNAAAGAFGAAVCSPLRAKVVPGGQQGAYDGPALSFFSVDAPNVEILTVKRASFGTPGDVVVRVRERDGGATTTSLRTAFGVQAAWACDMLETPLAAVVTSPVPIQLGAYETKTYRLRLAPGAGFAGDSIGVYDPASGAWFLRNTNSPGGADVTVVYGPPNATPLVGDWNGDGVDTIGIYDPATAAFFLRNSATPGGADAVFTFGAAGAGLRPLAGDWNGDGTDTIGLYDPTTGAFFLRNASSPGPADVVFTYGPANVQPLVGDWNGDGVDTVGVYLGATGAFFLRNANGPGGADVVLTYGAGGGIARTGDWNGDGVDTIGLYVPETGVFFLRNANTPGPASAVFGYGPASVTPLAGNWDGR